MSRLTLVVHPRFDASWPFGVADLVERWPAAEAPTVVRLPVGSTDSLGAVVRGMPQAERIELLMSLGVRVSPSCLDELPALKYAWFDAKGTAPAELIDQLAERSIVNVCHRDKAYYASSVSEMALGLTISALRRIPLMDTRVRSADMEVWTANPPSDGQPPGLRGEQFADDPRFVNGTIAGKQVRVLGAGNIGARFAAAARFLGAEVKAYDPAVSDLTLTLAGVERAHSLDELIDGADIFVPMLPRTSRTEGMVTAEHVRALPRGGLVVLAARARVCDMAELRRRVMAEELSLAADVFDVEPLAAQDPLFELEHVVLTPHLAGRTRDTNRAWARLAVTQLIDVVGVNDD